jgi:site-specific DNA-adenine methylase
MRLALTMEKFTFWGNDGDDLADSIKELLDKKHFVKLRMTSSTELSEDLYRLDCMAQMWKVQMTIDYEIDESYSNKPARVVVHLNPNYTYSGNSKSESDE